MERAKRLAAHNKATVRKTVGVGVATGSALLLGWFKGRHPDRATVFGMDVSLVIGAGGLIAGAFNVGGEEASGYIEDAAMGALCQWAGVKGYELGTESANEEAA